MSLLSINSMEIIYYLDHNYLLFNDKIDFYNLFRY